MIIIMIKGNKSLTKQKYLKNQKIENRIFPK